MGIPLIIRDAVIGVFALQSYKDESAYDERDLRLMEFISYQIGISLERKKSDMEIKRALVKAQESDRLKSSFLNNISHELRTPLNAVMGFSNLIDRDTPLDDIISYSKMINEGGRELLEIIESIFDIIILESDSVKITNTEFSLIDLMEELYKVSVDLLKETKKPGIEIKTKPMISDEDILMYSDYRKIFQVLTNLIKNALKFTEIGSIEFGYNRVEDADDPLVEFYVKDTGIGISKEYHEIIFDSFYKLSDLNTQIFGGIGIGLTLVKRTVKLLRGEVRIESEPGKGSVFFVTIPLPRIDKGLAQPYRRMKKLNGNHFPGKTILVAEDEKSNFDLLNEYLKNTQSNILWARNGKEALENCKANKNIDIVLMDIRMPIMDGFVATEKIKKMNPRIKIVAQTSFSLNADSEKAFNAGCDDFLTKPIEKAELLEILDKYLSK